MKVVKRNGTTVDYNSDRIRRAISLAMSETNDEYSIFEVNKVIKAIENLMFDGIKVDDVQNLVESMLMKFGYYDTAKAYILYRAKRDANRGKEQVGLLSPEFLSKYKHINPFPYELGMFTYVRTYSQFLPEEKRREFWWETVRRAVEYNCSLAKVSVQEAELMFDNIFNLRQFPSGRTLWAGGGIVSKNYPMSNYNCAFGVVKDIDILWETFYLLLVGAGVGFRPLISDVVELPRLRQDIEVEHMYYNPVTPLYRKEYTEIQVFVDEITIVVGDSKEGWTQAYQHYLNILTDRRYKKVNYIRFNYDNVRPKGERLKTFGGFASGHEALHDMFVKIDKVIKSNKHDGKLIPREVVDILNLTGEGVVSGGVRRTAEIGLIDATDNESITMKNDLYTLKDGEWVVNQDIIHRQMSNNSIYYTEKPTRERLHWQIEQMRYSGEPAWVNAEAGAKRRPNFNGVNPCAEILLDSRGLCNLTEINMMAFLVDNGSRLDMGKLIEAQKLSVRIGMRMTLPEFELHAWDLINKRDRLIGVSISGWQDMVNALNLTMNEQAELLRLLRTVAHTEAKSYAKELGINEPLLKTTIKPSGTLSLLPTVSAGIHYSHSPYYIRRIRISANDPLAKAVIDMGYQWNPEVGQTVENMSTVVIDFPVKAPSGKTKDDVSAIEQLENYKLFMENYVDHNVSITVHVRDNEWDAVEQWVWDNWDTVVAVSFIPYNDAFYQLMPYESITEEQFFELVDKTPSFKYSVLQKFEDGKEFEVASDCDTGACPVR